MGSVIIGPEGVPKSRLTFYVPSNVLVRNEAILLSLNERKMEHYVSTGRLYVYDAKIKIKLKVIMPR